LLKPPARVRQPELTDDLALDADGHAHAVCGLARINRVSGSSRILWRALAPLLCASPSKEFRLLDVAAGAGDVVIGLCARARRAGIRLSADAVDFNPKALEIGRQWAAAAGANVRFFALDVLRQAIPQIYDIVTCSLLLHHLSDEQAVDLLRKLAACTRGVLLVNDLRRAWGSIFEVYLATRFLTTSPVTRIDGMRSVRAAYTTEEMRALAAQAGLQGTEVSPRRPARLLLQWRRPETWA
jgi:2-polyprenyl-3-methyl-5-hydroxy-6-metoxy-1,4-benzoquinol methylase